MPQIVLCKLIGRHHDALLVGHFGIKKYRKLLSWSITWNHSVGITKAMSKASTLVPLSKKPSTSSM